MPKPYYKSGGVTLYNGDCRDILPSLPLADLVLTDPPYEMIAPPFEAIVSKLTERGSIYCFGNMDRIAQTWFSSFPMANKTVLAWYYKNSPKPKGRWRMAMQGIIYGYKPQAPFNQDEARIEYTPSAKALNGRKRPSSGRLGSCAKYDTSKGALPRSVIEWPALTGHLSKERVGHPDQKPIGLIRRLILTSSPRRILDPFAGSGTTLVAASGLGKEAIGIEREKRYCAMIVERLAQKR